MIGVFDSGLGGLTILRSLIRDFPDEDFLYYGDSAYAPYGRREKDQIYTLTRRGVEYLFEKGCRLVIIACNTACAIALRNLQQDWLPYVAWGKRQMKPTKFLINQQNSPPAYNVIGVLVPLIEAISGQDWHLKPLHPHDPHREVHRVGFFATRATVNSNRFEIEMARLAPEIKVIQQACHRLADFIEADAPREDIEGGIQRYCRNLMVQAKAAGIDLAVLGCTHYQLVAELFRIHLPNNCKLVHQPDAVSNSLGFYLQRHPEYRNATLSNEKKGVRFATSGNPITVSRAATRFWGAEVQFIYKDDIKE